MPIVYVRSTLIQKGNENHDANRIESKMQLMGKNFSNQVDFFPFVDNCEAPRHFAAPSVEEK